MNLYCVVEGPVERRVYKKWIPLLNNKLKYVESIYDIEDNHFSIVSGEGYPQYFEVIKDSIKDINAAGNIDTLLVAIDSEEMSYEDKYGEMEQYLEQFECKSNISIIIQHFCIEAWALANNKFGPNRPKSEQLIKYKKIYNVLELDPEGLPDNPEEELNRAKFAFKYLKTMLKDKNPRLVYSKRNPKMIEHPSYLEQIRKRFQETNHIESFSKLIETIV